MIVAFRIVSELIDVYPDVEQGRVIDHHRDWPEGKYLKQIIVLSYLNISSQPAARNVIGCDGLPEKRT